MSLSREAILGYVDTRIGRVDVPEMGGEVCVASFTVAEADKIKSLGEGSLPMVAELVILGVCDAKGKRLFTVEDGEALMALPAKAIGVIADAILEHNGLKPSAAEDAKNASGETESADFDSASLSPSDAPSQS